jgi:hypothetical protein
LEVRERKKKREKKRKALSSFVKAEPLALSVSLFQIKLDQQECKAYNNTVIAKKSRLTTDKLDHQDAARIKRLLHFC